MTNWFAYILEEDELPPLSGHLIRRFSGVSRRFRNDRIFGRTTLEIQFIRLTAPFNKNTRHPGASFHGCMYLLFGRLCR